MALSKRTTRSVFLTFTALTLSVLIGGGKCDTGGNGGDGDGDDGDDVCVCPQIYDPQCGEDDQTYGNACEADCEGIPIAYPGECQDEPNITCANVLCAIGYVCEMQEVVCVTEPCPPQPVCVDVDEECGSNVCGEGQYCCNASCSMCAPHGVACTQQACEDPASTDE